MKYINEDIAGQNLKQAYLLYGPEDYLKKQYRDKLKAALTEGDTMNCHLYQGKGAPIPEIIDLAETMPFFASRRVIIMEDTGLFKADGEKLAEYLENPAPSAFFVFMESEVDKRSKLYKTVKKLGRDTEFVTPDGSMLTKWILGMVGREKKQISQGAMQLFLEKTGSDMENISHELEKLLSYCMEKDAIMEEDVEAICTKQLSSHIFEMIEAIGMKQQKKALMLYYELLALKVSPFQILALLGRQFHILLQIKECRQLGYPEKEMATKVGIPPFTVKKYLTQAGLFQTKDLRKALEDCVQADEDIKTGRMDQQLAIELLIVQYSSKREERKKI